MYHDHQRSNKYLSLKKQQIKNVSLPFFSMSTAKKQERLKSLPN